jgi:hypothetical protein
VVVDDVEDAAHVGSGFEGEVEGAGGGAVGSVGGGVADGLPAVPAGRRRRRGRRSAAAAGRWSRGAGAARRSGPATTAR